MDAGKVDGFYGIDGGINAKTHSPEEIAGLIIQRLTGIPVIPISADSQRISPVTNLPERNRSFTGRTVELKKIHDAFANGGLEIFLSIHYRPWCDTNEHWRGM